MHTRGQPRMHLCHICWHTKQIRRILEHYIRYMAACICICGSYWVSVFELSACLWLASWVVIPACASEENKLVDVDEEQVNQMLALAEELSTMKEERSLHATMPHL